MNMMALLRARRATVASFLLAAELATAHLKRLRASFLGWCGSAGRRDDGEELCLMARTRSASPAQSTRGALRAIRARDLGVACIGAPYSQKDAPRPQLSNGIGVHGSARLWRRAARSGVHEKLLRKSLKRS